LHFMLLLPPKREFLNKPTAVQSIVSVTEESPCKARK
jgi:hypothetical protein